MFFGLRNKQAKVKEDISDLSQAIFQIKTAVRQLQEEIYEIREGTLGMGSRMKQMNVEINSLQQKHQDLVNQEPGSKLYSQAAKLVAAGADIESLMQECELPRAEAELLFNLHKKPS